MAIGTDVRVWAAGALVALVATIALRAWRVAATVAFAVVAAVAAAAVLKQLIDRARPPADLALVHLDGPGMPSTHAALSAAAGTAVFLALSPALRRAYLGVLIAMVVLGIGAFMVYLGVHWHGYPRGLGARSRCRHWDRRCHPPGTPVANEAPLIRRDCLAWARIGS